MANVDAERKGGSGPVEPMSERSGPPPALAPPASAARRSCPPPPPTSGRGANGYPQTPETPLTAGSEEELQPPQQPVSEVEVTKWTEMIEGVGISNYIRAHPDRFRRRVRRGIPQQYRWQVWKAAVHLQAHEHILALDYGQLCIHSNAWTSVIEIDIARTFPELKSFGQNHQNQLWRVLNAYASYNPDLGYCQGMNFVAGLLLLVSNFHEEESFRVLVCLMDHVGLAGFYGEKLPLFRRYLRACDMLVKETVPDLREHFKKENVNAPVYLHQWFLTLFINCFPLSMVTIIWDVIICEGLEVVLRIAVSILQVLKESLLAMQFEEIIKFFKMMKTYNDEDGELNAFRIGQLLMKHTELVKVPQNILDELSNDAGDDDAFLDSDEAPEADGVGGGAWLTGFGRVLSNLSMFSYTSSRSGKTRTPGGARSPSETPTHSNNSSPTLPGATPASAGARGSSSAPATHSDRDADVETLTRGWEFL